MVVAGSVVAALSVGCTSPANTQNGQSPSASGSGQGQVAITILEPDSGMGWSRDAGGANTQYAVNLHATLLRKAYVPGVSGFDQQNPYEYVGYLADSYEVSSDGLTYTFHLSDAVSAGGNELTAQDVLWSFQRKWEVPTSTAPGTMKDVMTDPDEQIKVIDDKTVSFTIPNAGQGATFLAMMSDLLTFIFDSRLLQEHATTDDPWAIEWSKQNPNYGFGAYEVEAWSVGEYARFVARKDYVLGAPKVDIVQVQIVPDAGTRANAVKNGDAQIATALTAADALGLEGNAAVSVPEIDVPNQFLEMPLVTNKAPFNDVLVRRAMAYAVPYDQIISAVYGGRALRQSSGFLLTNTPGYSAEGLTDYSYDPAKSKQLLSEAGLERVSFTLAVSAAEPDAEAVAIQIQTAAAEAGFDIKINKLPAADFAKGRTGHEFQALIWRDWSLTLTPSYELNLYTVPESPLNSADWTNEEFRKELATASAMTDQYSAEAGAAFSRANRIMIDESPIVFIAQVQPNVLLSNSVKGYAWRSDNNLDYANLYLAE